MRVYISSIGLLGPGLPDWQSGREILAGRRAYVDRELPKYSPDILPATERRRCGAAGKLAIYVADAAMRAAGRDAGSVASVFASSGGDLEISQKICLALAEAERFVSPTLFHNSVHNAAAGYWCIAAGSHLSSNSLSAHDWSVVAGLQAACSQVWVERLPVLLVCYDLPASEPLYSKRPVLSHFGAALLLEAEPAAPALASLELPAARAGGTATPMAETGLEELRRGNPAARILPLLAAVAAGEARSITLEAQLQTSVDVEIAPCR